VSRGWVGRSELGQIFVLAFLWRFFYFLAARRAMPKNATRTKQVGKKSTHFSILLVKKFWTVNKKFGKNKNKNISISMAFCVFDF
jgi:hypothetical protein